MAFVKQSPVVWVACRSCNNTSSSDTLPSKFPLTREAKVALLLHKITSTPPPSCVCGKGPAVAYCTECEKGVFLCKDCWEYHQGYLISRKHFSLVLDEAREEEVDLKQNLLPNDAKMCKLHSDQKLDFLCLDCATPLCVKCTQMNERDLAPLSGAQKQQVEKRRASVATALEEFPETQAKLQQAVNIIADTKEEVKKQKKKVEAMVRFSFDHLRRLLDRREIMLLGKCEEMASCKSIGLNLQQEEIQKLLTILNHSWELANNPWNAGEHHEMEFLSDVLAQMELVFSKISKISLDPCENATIPFEVSTAELEASIAILGHVGVTDSAVITASVVTTASVVASKIKVTLPARFCTFREECVKVTAEWEDIDYSLLRVGLTKKGQVEAQEVVVKCSEEDGSYLLFVKPQDEGEYLLSVTVCGQHVPNSPFLLPVYNREYYRTNFEQPVQTIDIHEPRHIAFSSNGDMFVTSTHTHSVHVFDRNGEKKREIGKRGKGNLEFNHPFGIAISGDVVYVADSKNRRIQKFCTNGSFLTTFGELSGLRGLTIGPDGMVYVSDVDNHRVVVFTDIGVCFRKIDVSGIVRSPWGLAFSDDGNLHVIGNGIDNYYAVLTSTGMLVRRRTCTCIYSTDVAIDVSGFSLALGCQNSSNSFSIFDPSGHVVHTVRLDHPWGVAIAPNGSVWVSGYSRNKLWKF